MYKYKEQKEHIFTDEGQRDFLKVRDHVNKLIDEAGAVTMAKAIKPLIGDMWKMMAHVDRLVELGEIKEITGDNVDGQCRIFTKP